MSGVNPQGCEVTAFKRPSADELSHDFLWRCEKALPARGRIGIFNRSYYEEVLVTRSIPTSSLPSTSRRHGDREETVAPALRRHQRLRASSSAQRDALRQALPPRLQGRAEEAPPAAARRPGQALEVFGRRPWRSGVLRRLHARVREGDHRDVDAWAPWYVVPADHSTPGERSRGRLGPRHRTTRPSPARARWRRACGARPSPTGAPRGMSARVEMGNGSRREERWAETGSAAVPTTTPASTASPGRLNAVVPLSRVTSTSAGAIPVISPGRDHLRARPREERDGTAQAPRKRCRGLCRIGSLRSGRSRCRSTAGGGVVECQLR